MAKRVHGEWAKSLPYTDKQFRPYVIALGQLTLAWNDLHMSLSMLFCTVMGGGFLNKFLAIWQNISSDRMQRKVLLETIKHDYVIMGKGNEKLRSGIEWICSEADKLEETRNNALHSPLWAYERSSSETIVMPVTGLGHVRAKKLAGKDLLSEFRRCRDVSVILRNFTMQIDEALKLGIGPWPDMPKLPNRSATTKCSPPKIQKAKRPSPAQKLGK